MSAGQTMTQRVEHYLACRHELGYELKIEGAELLRFARFADKKGFVGPLTNKIAIEWAQACPATSRLYYARRLDVVRRFAKFRLAYESGVEVPPVGYFGPSNRRHPVHIYSDDQIVALLNAASKLGPARGLRPQTLLTLFGLLFATGLRISEALRLTIHDIDWDQGRLRVQGSKCKEPRLLPVHESTLKALHHYDQFRHRYHGAIESESFFVTELATPLKYWRTFMAFCQLRRTLDWDELNPRPRIHDLRHTFAVRCLLRWYRSGENIDGKILALQTYLGHKKVTDTYWYLSAIPELMALGSARFERFVGREGGSSFS